MGRGVYMNDKLCVSVIFATYNRASIIEHVLDAWHKVDEVTKYSYEIICSDDESSDNTVSLLRKNEGLPITVINNSHGGASKARNAALKIAKGDVIIFTGDDIFPEPDFINKHYENYLKYGSKIATLGQIIWHQDIEMNHLMNHITNIGCEQFSFCGLPTYQLIDFRHFYTSNISVAKSELEALSQYFDLSFDKYGFEDIELGYRMEKNGVHIFYDPEIRVSHHHIYNSVDKFCYRQYSAGDQLVVFNKLHPDLQDKCGIDINELRELFCEFVRSKKRYLFRGFMIKQELWAGKLSTKILELLIRKTHSSALKSICSALYGRIFFYYIVLGCTSRIAKDENINVHDEVIYQFVRHYINRDYHQIFYDLGDGFSEDKSFKVAYLGNRYVEFERPIPSNIKQLRFDILASQCISNDVNVYVISETGEHEELEVEYANAQSINDKTFDFMNTIDPQIYYKSFSANSAKVHVSLEVSKLHKTSFVNKSINKLKKIRRIFINSKQQKANADLWKSEYSQLQPRRIQLCIGGNKENRDSMIRQYQEKLSIYGDFVTVSDINHKKEGYINYIYNPRTNYLHPIQMAQTVYTLLNFSYDYIIVSNGLSTFPELDSECLDDAVIFMELLGCSIQTINLETAKGRFIRLPVSNNKVRVINISNEFKNISLKDECKLNGSGVVEFQLNPRNYVYHKKKPLVFVFPIFMAVGGVERNTIEMMRELQSSYSFCVFTMERHNQLQGSLHYQLVGLCDYIFDLREISEFDHFLDLINDFKNMFKPDLIWLCNNSPWFEANSLAIRRIFHDVPIVAQDAYDTNVGWIEYYNTPGIQSFDRFIAINQKIKSVFIDKYKVDENKIDVIYSAIDGSKVISQKKTNNSREDIENKYNFQHGKKHFAFIGRLTDQKNPIRYLKLVKDSIEKYPDVEFVMVGDGILNEAVETFITTHNIRNHIIRIPYVDNTIEFISILDGLILTSDYEGLAIVSIEAMSLGIPILSTDTGDLKSFISKTNGGLIINENINDCSNFDMFYSNLTEFAENARKSSQDILSFFSVSIIGNQYKEVFAKAIDKYKEG
jgi:glycosyltransferase involved in cell wall biosynthesis